MTVEPEWRESRECFGLHAALSFFFLPVYAPAALGTKTGSEKT